VNKREHGEAIWMIYLYDVVFLGKEREYGEAIWMVHLYDVVFLGILYGVCDGGPSQRGSFFWVDLA
jgi:hypothetical protein